MTALAETKWDHINRRNELRIGWGDQLFESLVWHNPTSVTTTMPAEATYQYKERYRHHQHLWMEYQYRFKHWFSLGAMVDMSEVGWDVVTRNGQGAELARDKKNYFYNLVVWISTAVRRSMAKVVIQPSAQRLTSLSWVSLPTTTGGSAPLTSAACTHSRTLTPSIWLLHES